ncbi:MAG: hypothetical protein M5R40_12685 [Anaerolineae bacterium]|nr:hypothetical protein [Anaerolineae bacterium]
MGAGDKRRGAGCGDPGAARDQDSANLPQLLRGHNTNEIEEKIATLYAKGPACAPYGMRYRTASRPSLGPEVSHDLNVDGDSVKRGEYHIRLCQSIERHLVADHHHQADFICPHTVFLPQAHPDTDHIRLAHQFQSQSFA